MNLFCKKKLFIHIIYFFLFINILPLCAFDIYVPEFNDPMEEAWRWQVFPELSGRGCRCMVEDENGLLWFGVNGGLLRYDGLEWDYIKLNNDSTKTNVVALCAAGDGSIYVGTPDGIYRFINGTWKQFDCDLGFGDTLDFPNNMFPIVEGSDHSIWVGTHKGMLRIKNNLMTLYNKDQVFTDFNEKTGVPEEIPSFNVFSIYEQTPGKIWCGLRDGRIFIYEFKNDSINIPPVIKQIDRDKGYKRAQFPFIIGAGDENIYIASGQIDRGVNVYENSEWKTIRFSQMFGLDDLHSDALVSKDGTVWVASFGCVFACKNEKWYMYNGPGLRLPANRWNLYETTNNSLWIIGLGNEVWRVDLSNDKWKTLKGLHFHTQNRNGDLWFIAWDDAVVTCDSSLQNWKQYTTKDNVIDCPVSVLASQDGKIWVTGSDNQTAAISCYNGEKWVKFLHPEISWGIGRRAVLEAQDGSLWFGTGPDYSFGNGHLGGFVRYKNYQHIFETGPELEYHHFNDSLRLSAIYGIGQSANGLIWTGQLACYNYDQNIKKWSRVFEPKGLDESFIDCIYTSPNGNLWIGTRTSGVFWYLSELNEWRQFTRKDGLSSNCIVNIFAKSDSNVWVATDQNICHFDGFSWTADVFPSFFRITKDGILIKSTDDGAFWFNQIPQPWIKRAINRKAVSQELASEYITIRYMPDDVPPETVITYSQDRIAHPGNVVLSWTGHDPWRSTPDELLQYSSRFDGKDWSPFNSGKSHIFLNVSDGKHKFELRARDRDMNIDPVPAQVVFYVNPPLWKQYWFLGLIFFFLATITGFIIYLVHRNNIIKELSESKVRLFANISHELCTPLTLIAGPVKNVLKTLDHKSSLYQQLSMVRRNCDRLIKLVSQIMDFQKIDSNTLMFLPQKSNIVSFIKDIFDSFQPLACDKKVNFLFKSELDSLEMFFDGDKIEKIFYNLFANAFKFTPEHGTISITIQRILDNPKLKLTSEKDKLVITVKDTGMGIPAEKIDKIFNRFYQVNESITQAGGAGIGLSLTKELVERHHGKIEVQSFPEQGTEFRVIIPILSEYKKSVPTHIIEPDIMEHETAALMVDSNTSTPKNEKLKILLVEDNADMRAFIKSELDSMYHIVEAVDGQDGLQKAVSYTPDIILSDIMMPNMNGIEMSKKLKADYQTSHIPIILLTARSSQEHKIKGLETGAVDYVTKPFNSKELELRITNIIQSRKNLWQRFHREDSVKPEELSITSVDQQFLKRAVDLVHKNMDDPEFNPQIFGEKIGMSRAGLYNKIKMLTGYSVRDFIISIRLKRSAQLLKESGMTITQIAYEVGFKDPSHFTRAFKKQFGVPPSEFAKKSE